MIAAAMTVPDRRLKTPSLRISTGEDVDFIKSRVTDIEFLGKVSFSDSIMESDIQGIPSYKASQQTLEEAGTIKKNLEILLEKKT